MSNQILVTDELFIYQPEIEQFEAAGYEVVRMRGELTEDELCQAIKGKVGYIMGGVEKVTAKVVEAADELKVICFTGIGYPYYVPAFREAIAKGIAVSYCPDGPTHATVEWALAAALLMNRNLLDLGRTGDVGFKITPGLENQQIGIIGMGRIGSEIARMLMPFRPAAVSYWNRSEVQSDANPLPMNEVLRQSDIVFLCVGDSTPAGFIGQNELALLKPDALVVDITRPHIVDVEAQFTALSQGKIRMASCNKRDERFEKLPLRSWWSMNEAPVSFTDSMVHEVSRMATTSVLNILTTGADQYLIPEMRA